MQRQFTKLFLHNIDFKVSNEDVLHLFSQFGKVKAVQIPRDKEGRHRGLGFVEFEEHVGAKAALDRGSIVLLGREMRLDIFREKHELHEKRKFKSRSRSPYQHRRIPPQFKRQYTPERMPKHRIPPHQMDDLKMRRREDLEEEGRDTELSSASKGSLSPLNLTIEGDPKAIEEVAIAPTIVDKPRRRDLDRYDQERRYYDERSYSLKQDPYFDHRDYYERDYDYYRPDFRPRGRPHFSRRGFDYIDQKLPKRTPFYEEFERHYERDWGRNLGGASDRNPLYHDRHYDRDYYQRPPYKRFDM